MNNFTQNFYKKKGKTLVNRLMCVFGLLLMSTQISWGQTGVTSGYEDGTTPAWTSPVTETVSNSIANARTGTKSLMLSTTSTSTNRQWYGSTQTVASGPSPINNIHIIYWALNGATATNVDASSRYSSSAGVNGTDVAINNSTWTRISSVTTTTSVRNYYLSPIRSVSAALSFWIDDVVIYSSPSATTDLTAPSVATTATGTTTGLSWTNGTDTGTGATGVQATLIFKRTTGTVGVNDLSLNGQGVYSLTATTGPGVVGNWTLQNANVTSAAITYAGSFTSGEEYAIVHRDLAYNYSLPTYVVIPASGPVISTTSNFSAVSTTYGTASANTIINVSGTSMTAGISVNPPAGFEVSTTSDFSSNVGTNGSPITVGAAGTIVSTAVYVRLLATATVAGSTYSGNVVLTSSDATTVNMAIPSSTVSAKALTITGLTGANKSYDGNTTASFTGTPAYSGLVSPDSFSVTGTPVATFANATAGDGKTITITGYTSPTTNYTVTQPSLTGNITKVGLTVTAGNQTVAYGTPVATITGAGNYISTGFVNGETSSVITGSVSYTTNYTDTTPAATSGVTITPAVGTLSATNYSFGTFADGTITVTNSLTPQTISFTLASPVVYGSGTITLNGTATSGLTVSYVSSNPTVASVSGNVVTILSVGTTTITASQAGDTTYSPATTVGQSLVVNCGSTNFNTTTIIECDTYSWANNGQTYTASGTYTGTTTNCTTEQLVLTITPSSINTTTVTACASYVWANNGLTYTTSGIKTGTTTNCVTEKLDLTIVTPINYYADTDGDGYGFGTAVPKCNGIDSTVGYVTNNTDCDDANPAKWQSGNFYQDLDGDGYTDTTSASASVCYGATVPTGYYTTPSTLSKTWVFTNATTWPSAGTTVEKVSDKLGLYPFANGTTAYAKTGGSVNNYPVNVYIAPVAFTSATNFQLNGSSNPVGNKPTEAYSYFDVAGSCKVTIWFKTLAIGSYLKVSDGTTLLGTGTSASAGALISFKAVYIGGPTRLYIYGNDGSFLHKIEVTGSAVNNITLAPVLTADTTANTVDNNLEVTSGNNTTWGAAITEVKIGETSLAAGDWDNTTTPGTLTLKPSNGNSLLTTSGSKVIKIIATGYSDAKVTQVINAGVPTVVNSSVAISPALALNTTSSITITAKDQYNNLVSGYVFNYDVTITNANTNSGSNTESYIIGGATTTLTANNVPVTTTNASGVATFDVIIPSVVDGNDGINIQVQLNNGTTNVGNAFNFTKAFIPQTITFEALASKTFGDASFALTGTASSGLGVTYTSSDLNVAIVSGSTVTIVGAGTTTITASQVGNANYNPAPDATQTLTIAPANNWIGGTGNWNTPANWSLTRIPSSLNDNITISSGTPVMDVNYTVGTGRTLTISSTGTLTINPTSVLTLSGTANFGGRSVVLKSDATGTGTIGQVTGTLTGATNVTAERYIPSGKRAFRFLTPSVTTSGSIFANWQNNGATTAGIGTHITGSTTGANGFDATASGSPSMYTYQNTVASGTGWLAIPNTDSTSLVAGMGYRTLVRGDRNVNITIASSDSMNVATTISATGTLKVGNVVFDSSSTPALNTTSNTTTNFYSLIGNPYASPVDWELVSRTNVDVFYYTWDPNMGTQSERGRYVAYSASSHMATNTGSGTSYVNRYIQPGQAIFVKTIGSNPSLTFKEADKNTTFTNVFRTSTNSTLSVSVYNPSEVAFAAPIDGTIAVFGTDFDASVGIGDVVKMYSAGEHLAWSRDTKLLGIDATTPVVANDQLLLKTMQFAANKSYTFKVSATNFDTSLTGYLVDQYLNSQTQLDFNTANFITFATTTDANSYGADRFKVVFSPTVLNTNVWNESTVHIYPNPVTNNQFAISVPSLTNGKVTVTIHNLIGQSVYKESTSAINNTIIVRPSALLKAGVYSVEIENEGKRSAQKIIIK